LDEQPGVAEATVGEMRFPGSGSQRMGIPSGHTLTSALEAHTYSLRLTYYALRLTPSHLTFTGITIDQHVIDEPGRADLGRDGRQAGWADGFRINEGVEVNDRNVLRMN